jgi:alanine dehydrogenase
VETLILARELIAQIVPPGAYLDAVRTAFRQLGSGEVATPPVAHLDGLDGKFHIKAAVRSTHPHRAAVKVNGNFPHNAARHELPVIQGFIALLDAERGAVLALMDSTEITARRTAACSALAAQRLAPANARHLALIGCGVQARYHVEALAQLFSLESIALYDNVAERAIELAGDLQDRFNVEVQPSPAAAARGAQIIVTATPSRTALLDAGDVETGCFIAGVGADSAGKQELSPALLGRARVVPDVLAQAIHMGDLQHAVRAGVMTQADIHGELADVVLGRVPGRTSAGQIFIFDSTGTGIADLAAAEIVYERAHDDPRALRIRL